MLFWMGLRLTCHACLSNHPMLLPMLLLLLQRSGATWQVCTRMMLAHWRWCWGHW
jgi:hypothetical protein